MTSLRTSAQEAIVNVATVELRFEAVVLIEKIGVAGSHFDTWAMATANEKQFSVNTSSARRSSVSELGSLTVRKSKNV